MNNKCAIIVTSISSPNKIMRALAEGAMKNEFEFIVIGDLKSPEEFVLDGCNYFDIERQCNTKFKFATKCPTSHYARKNIGYLLAINNGANVIIETDDDNMPRESFFIEREEVVLVDTVEHADWVNVYRFFSEELIWPRGLPLGYVKNDVQALQPLQHKLVKCPIQQGLADENPDVDAIYRLLLPLPQKFSKNVKVALGKNSWCPFNSQNTTWFSSAFPLLYLPSYCSFRMTDIWRSFVAQRIAWENEWYVLFHEASVWQERNEHNLIKDFEDEIPGYLNNVNIVNEFKSLALKKGSSNIFENLRKCYGALIGLGVVDPKELKLLDFWLEDIAFAGWKFS